MSVRVRIARFNRATPLAYDLEIHALEVTHLGLDVDEVDASIETPEKAVRGVQKPERFLTPPQSLIQQRELARRFRLIERRADIRRELYRSAKSRLRESRAPCLPIHHAEEAIGARL